MKKIFVFIIIILSLHAKGQVPQAPMVFSNITQMQTYRGTYYFAALTDTLLGGLFTTVFGTYVPDNLNIIITGVANRYWRRINNNSTPPGSGVVVNTISQLASTPPDSRNVGQVLGFYTPNDGGGGYFWFDSTDNSTTVAGFIIQVGSGNGRWKRIPTKGAIFDVRWFGVVGDGVTDNTTLLQNAVNYVGTFWKGNTLYFPGLDTSLFYRITSRVLLRSFVNLQGDGSNSLVYNTTSTNSPFGKSNVFGWGNMQVPSFQGLTQYSADSVYSNRIKLHTVGNATNFHKGDLICISSLTGFNGSGGFYRPYVGEVSKVDSVNTSTGVVIMDDLIDTSLIGANVGINGHFSGSSGAVDELGDSCRIIEYCNVSNMAFKSDSSWFGRTSMYKCNFDNIWSTGLNGWGGNCMSRCIFTHFRMRFWRRAQEMDLFAHDSRYEDFTATFIPGMSNDTNRLPQIRFGENCRNLYVYNYILNITGYSCANPVEFNEGFNNTISNLTVYGNLNNQGDVEFNNGANVDSAFVVNNKIINSSFFLDTTGNHYVKFSNNGLGHATNKGNLVANCYFYHNLGGAKVSIYFDGANNNVLGGIMPDTSAVISTVPSTTSNCIVSGTLLRHTLSDAGAFSVFGVLNDGKHNIIAPDAVNVNAHSLSGGFNTAMGYQALDTLTSGVMNTAYGYWALASTRTGINNTAVGAEALDFADTAASGNTAIGYRSLRFVQNGTNTAVGDQALLHLTTGQATAMGYQALTFDSTGTRNTAFGYQAGMNIGSGNDNSLFGRLAGDSLTTGTGNVFIGLTAGQNAITATNNIAIGKGTRLTHYNDTNTVNIRDNFFIVNTSNPGSVDSTSVGAARVGIGNRNPVGFLDIPAATGTVPSIVINEGTQPSNTEGAFYVNSTSKQAFMYLNGMWQYVATIPRLTSAQRNALVSPPTGMIVYDTSINELTFFNGTSWLEFATNPAP